MKGKAIIGLLLILSFTSLCLHSEKIPADKPYFFELTLKTYGGGRWADVSLFIAQYLEDIGIKVHIKLIEWTLFVSNLIYTYDYDLAIVGIAGGSSPDSRSIFTEVGSLNLFGLDNSIPYQNLSQTMQDVGVTIVDPIARQTHYNDWQTLVMDKIIPFVPLYSYVDVEALWSNLYGYDSSWGLSESLPYMQFYGLHSGQSSTDELNEHDLQWVELNPLLSDDGPSSHIVSLILERIFQLSPGYEPLKTGLVNNWEKIDDYHFKFFMRDNVYWNPSYDVTARTAASAPLSSIPSNELMTGLKYGEYSDGTNQQVTAKDAVFTYLIWGNSLVSEDVSYHDWISDCYVDPVDPLAFHIHIDANPATPEKELHVDFWNLLPFEILPEFFLNSTDPTVSYTAGGAKCWGIYTNMDLTTPWIDYSNTAFGCGKYMLDYYIFHSITVLQKSPYWMGYGAIDGTLQDLDIQSINVKVIPDSSVALDAFKLGYLDKIPLPANSEEIELMQEDSNYKLKTKLRAYFDFMGINLQRDPLGGSNNYIFLTEPGKEEYTVGLALRKAISYAIDRVEMTNLIPEMNLAVIADSPISPFTSFYYYDDIIKYRRDLSAAWEWMEAAGYDQVDLLTGYTFTSYDDPPETTTVTNTETVVITETETVSFFNEKPQQQPAETTINPLSIIVISIAFTVIIVLQRIRKHKKKS